MAEREQAGKGKRRGLSKGGLLIDARRSFLPPRRAKKAIAHGQLRLLQPGREGELPSAA